MQQNMSNSEIERIEEYGRRVAEELKKAIENDVDARELLYNMLISNENFRNIFLNLALINEPTIDILLTDKGKQWVQKNIIPLLEYVKKIVTNVKKQILEEQQ